MPKDELVDLVATNSTTRRTIVKTGAKLAYAAPLVAATTKLGGGAARAQAVSGPNPHPECIGSTCSSLANCNSENPDCLCFTLSTGGGFCMPGSTSCNVVGPCGSDLSCPSGSVCIVNSCCGPAQCAPLALGDQCLVGATGESVQGESTGPTFGGV